MKKVKNQHWVVYFILFILIFYTFGTDKIYADSSEECDHRYEEVGRKYEEDGSIHYVIVSTKCRYCGEKGPSRHWPKSHNMQEQYSTYSSMNEKEHSHTIYLKCICNATDIEIKTESHGSLKTVSKELKSKSQSSCKEEVKKKCSKDCGYNTTETVTHSHTRGTTCNICHMYYPTYQEESQTNIEASSDEQTVSEESWENVDEASGEIEEQSDNATGLNEQLTDDENSISDETKNQENAENGETAADPVRFTTGDYVSTSTDLIINNQSLNIAIQRFYNSSNKANYSFGKGWKFNYDSRIILGVRSDRIDMQSELPKIIAEMEAIYNGKDGKLGVEKNYQYALEAADRAIEYAEEAVRYANLAEGNNNEQIILKEIQKSRDMQSLSTSIQKTLIEKNKLINNNFNEVNTSNQTFESGEVIRDTSKNNLVEVEVFASETILQKAQRRLTEARPWKEILVGNEEIIDEMKKKINEVKGMLYQNIIDNEYSTQGKRLNQYNVDRNVNPDQDETGIGSIIYIDEQGTPHLYYLTEEPVYDSKIKYSDGTKNYYPQGSSSTPAQPNDDQLILQGDGSYLVTKKDKTTYQYSHYGKLVKIEDTNGRFLNFEYNEQKELTTITDNYQRTVKIDRVQGKIAKITDPLGREYKYGYQNDQLACYTDPEGNVRHYKYTEGLLTELIYSDGSGWK